MEENWMIRGTDTKGVAVVRMFTSKERAISMLLTWRKMGYQVELWERQRSWVLLPDVDI